MLIFRSDASRSELAELSRQANPDEIDIDSDDGGESEDNEPDGKRRWLWGLIQFVSVRCTDHLMFLSLPEVQLEQKSVPSAVFGGLKDD